MTLLNNETDQYREECDRILTELLKVKLYNEARLFAEVSKFSDQDITIHQVIYMGFIIFRNHSSWKFVFCK